MNLKSPIRTAVMGLGRMGMEWHCPTIERLRGFKLTAICDATPARLAIGQGKYSVKAYPAYEDLFADDNVDLVVIVTPSSMHTEHVVAALKAGKHVVVEKPMCTTVKEADRMIAAAEKAGRTLSVYQNRRWDEWVLSAGKVIESGALGKLTHIELLRHGFGGGWTGFGVKEYHVGWRGVAALGGGLLYDWGAHHIDGILLLAGAYSDENPNRPTRVFAQVESNRWSKEVDDHFRVVIEFESGCSALIEHTSIYHAGGGLSLFVGEKGTLRDNLLVTEQGDKTRQRKLKPGKNNWDEYYKSLYRHLTQGERLLVTPQQVRQVVQVFEAARKSSEKHQVVKTA